jgi:hypothetical protein
MGTDIHGFIDYDDPTNPTYCHHFAKMQLSRDYWMFILLASVRGDSIQKQQGLPAKGLPSQISWEIRDELYLKIVQDNNPLTEAGIGYIGETEANKYKRVDKYYCENPDWHSISYVSIEELDAVFSKYNTLQEIVPVVLEGEKPLPTDEIVSEREDRILVHRSQHVKVPANYLATRAAMAALRDFGCNPRFVFFFDN